MIDIDLVRKSYNDLSDLELIKLELENRQNISEEAIIILEEEIQKRNINIPKIKEIIAMNDLEIYQSFISGIEFQNDGEVLMLLNEVKVRLKKYSKNFGNSMTSILIQKIKDHKIEKTLIPEEEYLALITFLNLKGLDKYEKNNLEKILNSTREQLLEENNPKKVETGSENDIISQLNKSGNEIKKIGINLTRFFIGQILFTMGYVLNIMISGKPQPFLLILNSFGVIIITIIIISGFYDAGNALINIKKETTNNPPND